MLKDGCAVASMVLVERDTFMGMTQKLHQSPLAVLDRHASQILAVQFEQVEGAKHGGAIMAISAD